MKTTLHNTDLAKKFRKDFIDEDGRPGVIIAKVRYGDGCGNGHNSFTITADVYGPRPCPGEPTTTHENGKTLWCWGGGCIHDEVKKHLPELAPFIKWHLCSTDGPMHYIANTVYHANNRDHRNLRKGEKKQLRNGKTGLGVWHIVLRDTDGNESDDAGRSGNWVESETKPNGTFSAEYEPVWLIGEGKERNLDAARRSAVWPDATDEDLTAPGLKERLEARLPALMAEFKTAIESFGFVY